MLLNFCLPLSPFLLLILYASSSILIAVQYLKYILSHGFPTVELLLGEPETHQNVQILIICSPFYMGLQRIKDYTFINMKINL